MQKKWLIEHFMTQPIDGWTLDYSDSKRHKQIALAPNRRKRKTITLGHEFIKWVPEHDNCQRCQFSCRNAERKQLKREKKFKINKANLFTHSISMSCVDAINDFVCASFIIPLKKWTKNESYLCMQSQPICDKYGYFQ